MFFLTVSRGDVGALKNLGLFSESGFRTILSEGVPFLDAFFLYCFIKKQTVEACAGGNYTIPTIFQKKR